MSTEPVYVTLTLHLAGGPSFRTRLAADSDLLRELHSALSAGLPGSEHYTPRLLQIPTEGGHGAFSFSSERLVALETSPPVLIDQVTRAAGQSQPDAGAKPAQPPPRRHGPVVRKPPQRERVAYEPVADLDAPPYICATDFLTPDERRQLLDAILAAAPTGAQVSDGSSVPVEPATPLHAERINRRLRLLLPQVLPGFAISRADRIGTVEFFAWYDNAHSGFKPASVAASNELSCSYFLQRQPGLSSGGELHFSDGAKEHVFEPCDNTLLIYPTCTLSAVSPLRQTAKDFSDCRFVASIRVT